MKLDGQLFVLVGTEEDAKVTEAIVTPKRISIDWEEDGQTGHRARGDVDLPMMLRAIQAPLLTSRLLKEEARRLDVAGS